MHQHARVLTDQELFDTGEQTTLTHFFGAVVICDCFHLEVIADEETFKLKLLRRGCMARGERVAVFSSRHDTTTWAVMMEATPALTAASKGTHSVVSSDAAHAQLSGARDGCRCRIAVTREMLSAGRDAVILKP